MLHTNEDAPTNPSTKYDVTTSENNPSFRPICVRILNANDDSKALSSYDAECYDGYNDSDVAHLTHLNTSHQLDDINIHTTDISSYMNMIHQTSSKSIFPMSDLHQSIQNTKILRMKLNLDTQQMDSGANRNVTNDKAIIRNYADITPIPIYGIDHRSAACHITGKGITELDTTDGSTLEIQMYYSQHCSGTIISPNAIVQSSRSFTSWIQTSHLDTGQANILFFHRTDYTQNKTIPMILQNDLWYIDQAYFSLVTKANKTKVCILRRGDDEDQFICVHKMNKSTEYELWHQRLMHPGKHCMDTIDKCTTGVPKLTRNNLHSCRVCNEMNIHKHYNKTTQQNNVLRFGDRFQMDFGFMSGKIDNKIVRSHEGYNCYLLIIDYYTRYTWVFLSKNKAPPLRTITQFLRTYGNTDGVRIIRTDQGGELARSTSFKEVVTKAEYTIEITGADNSSQNGLAERPHRTLGDMVRAGLENAGLHVKYWSDALLHAVFVKNRMPHSAFNHKITPYERLTGTPPDLSKLRIFGSRVVCRKPGRRTPKLTKHSYSGIFLRYAKTLKNIVYLDTNTNNIKTSTFARFDEAHFSYSDKPPGAKILIEMGMTEIDKDPIIVQPPDDLKIIKIDKEATPPQRASEKAVGYDLYSLQSYTIPPNNVGLIDTGIAAKFPTGTYGRIASRSGLALRHNLTVLGGVIDPDYTGAIKVLLYNFGTKPFTVNKSDRIAQLILERYQTSPITELSTKDLPNTTRSNNGFGSTGLNKHDKDRTSNVKISKLNTSTDSATLTMVLSQPVYLTTVKLRKNGSHPTLGLQLQNDDKGPRILMCKKGTPSARIPQWKRVLRNATIYAINDTLITNESNISEIIKNCPENDISLHIIPPSPVDIHPDTGVPQINYDQFLHLSAIHQDILHDNHQNVISSEQDNPDNIIINKLAKDAFTRTQLRKRPDWKEWEQSEFLQLEQYLRQNMFGEPGPLPSDTNNYSVLPMIWVYIIKTDGRKKARCVANGAPHLKGSITLAHTYAACIDQAACRLFWAIAAMKCKLVYGSDAVNAFAEAPPPKSPLYLKVDDAYRNWYKTKYDKDLSPSTYVRVHQAIQGHPESPRLWQQHIDSILLKIGFKPTTHEPCIYTLYSSTETIYMLRQVDDFAIACDDQRTASYYWDQMDKFLKEPLKREKGLLKRHNGIDVDQTEHGIKIHCNTYLNKILGTKTFDMTVPKNKPIPMLSESSNMRELESSKGTQSNTAAAEFYEQHGFKYRNATGELIFAMVTCRTDISFPVLKLTQYNNSPTTCHANAVKNVYKYLNATKSDGISFWRPRPNTMLPSALHETIDDSNYDVFIPPENAHSDIAYGYTDSDWANDSSTRKSVSGTAILLAGGSIVYKTILQKTVALSSTEAEFYALTDTGKLVLYVRMVLSDLGIDQNDATSIYEDNRGCLQMTQALKPTKRTRHVETKYFAILHWVQTDQLKIKKINTSDNASDVLTKATGKVLFYRHNATLMGKRKPSYVIGTHD